jgi:hypothetical protein
MTRSTTAAMEFDTNLFDWVNDTSTFVLLNNKDGHHSPPAKWAAFSNTQSSVPSPAFSIPPSLLTQASIEQYGQITPPRDLHPAELRRDSFREDSISAEQLQNKQTLQNYQPQQPDSQQQSQQDSPDRASKRRRTSKPAPANQSPPPPPISQQTDDPSPQPPKRKRGRPKSQPQMVEACTADGFLFQVSSARQSHLEKNRVAAHKCRMRKKEYINGLEGRAREYSNKNKLLKENVALLREEVLELKNEVLRHAGCGFWAVEEYLTRCAGDLLSIQAAAGMSGSGKRSQTQSLAISTMSPSKLLRVPSADSPSSQMTTESQHQEDHGGLDLLEDIDGETESPNV